MEAQVRTQTEAHADAHAVGRAHGQPHASTGTYLLVAAVLTVVTLIEFGIVYVQSLKGVAAPILIALSAIKFALVAAFFMHLRFDRRLLTGFFLVGIAFAAATLLAIRAMTS